MVVDLRSHSKTYGQWFDVKLCEENSKQFYISEKFAQGLLSLLDMSWLWCKEMDFYHLSDEGGLIWNSPEIVAQWTGMEGNYNGTASVEGYVIEGTPLIFSEKNQKWFGLKIHLSLERKFLCGAMKCNMYFW